MDQCKTANSRTKTWPTTLKESTWTLRIRLMVQVHKRFTISSAVVTLIMIRGIMIINKAKVTQRTLKKNPSGLVSLKTSLAAQSLRDTPSHSLTNVSNRTVGSEVVWWTAAGGQEKLVPAFWVAEKPKLTPHEQLNFFRLHYHFACVSNFCNPLRYYRTYPGISHNLQFSGM